MATAEYQRQWRAKHPGYHAEYQRWLRSNRPSEDKKKICKTQRERYRNDPVYREKKLAYNREWRHKQKLLNKEL